MNNSLVFILGVIILMIGTFLPLIIIAHYYPNNLELWQFIYALPGIIMGGFLIIYSIAKIPNDTSSMRLRR